MTIHHLAGDFHLPSTTPSYAPSLPLEPQHGELSIQPDILSHRLQASIKWTVLSHVNSAQEITFHAEDLQIIRCTSPNAEIKHQYDGHLLTIRFTQAIPKGESRSIQIDYQVHSPIAGLYFGGPTPDLPQRGYWMATDHETTRARYWLPCIDHSNVRTTFDILITHAKNHTAISAGHLHAQIELEGDLCLSHWKQEQRCPIYLLCIIVGEYERVDFEPLRNKPLAAFAPKGNRPEDIQRAFAPTKDLIVFAESLLGELPWDKYFQFAAPGIGGAMENISLVSWDSRLLFDENMHADLGHLFDQINLHELAHTWFGDLIVCRDYAHVWLKESWATYFECVWLEHKFDTDRHHLELIQKRERYFSEVAGRYSRPIMTRKFDSPWKMYDMHLYPGGAVRLHMLRKKIGDEEFWAATRDYVQTYAEKVVETDDFRHMMERHSGQSLAHFFDQWFCRAGYPKLSIKHQYFADSQIMRLQITQSIIGGHQDDEAFDFDLEIAIQTQEGLWSTHIVHIDSFHHTFRIALSEPAAQICIDPNCIAVMTLDFNPGLEMNKTALSTSPYLHGRIQAARNLIKEASHLAIAEIQQHYAEQHHGLREIIAQELGTCKHLKSTDLLTSWLASEKDSATLVAIANSLAKHPSDMVSQHLHGFIHRDDISHRAKGTALIAMAQQGPYADVNLLLQHCQDNGWRHYVRDFAVQSLKYLDSEEAFETLLLMVRSQDEAVRTRASACLSLVGLSKNLSQKEEERAKKALFGALKDADHLVRLQAVQALGILGHRDAIPHLREMYSQLASQYAPDITRAIQSCQKGTESNAAALNKRIAALEESNQKLMQQIQDIQAELNLKS